ncbi:SDR family NAD(P)-dependent oxidoreductase [Kiloniella sp.]|uniref:SDR family NAD(P)-dependent oxidoreductase n=1 Tax=Kiloniella sp. TaxID=1938587 RepID=UPI003B013DEE
MLKNQRFKGKAAIVTGGAGGIGSEVVRRLAKQGAQILLTDISQEACTKTQRKLQEEGLSVEICAADLTSRQGCDSIIETAIGKFGAIDILINNAGYMCRGPIEETSDEMWDMSFDVNVKAVFCLSRAATPYMRKRGGGAIVNTSSTWGVYPGPNHIAYCTSKGAVASLTKNMGRDLAVDNIRVNAVCPNEVNTPMIRSGFEIRGLDPDQAIDELNASVPLGRIAEPDDIADVILFLVSDEARYMAGAILEVSGAKPVY